MNNDLIAFLVQRNPLGGVQGSVTQSAERPSFAKKLVINTSLSILFVISHPPAFSVTIPLRAVSCPPSLSAAVPQVCKSLLPLRPHLESS